MRRLLTVLVVSLSVALLSAQARTTLDIYLVDVEGGNATLFVTPSGDSLLIDTGNGGAAAMRDADRIMAAAKDARLTQIDHLITTHWHGDHFGAMEYVASRIRSGSTSITEISWRGRARRTRSSAKAIPICTRSGPT